MRSNTLASVVVRIAFAAVFAFMSLFHGAVMSFAQTDHVAHDLAAKQVTQLVDHAGHHGHGGQGQKAKHAMPDTAPSCLGMGCFIALHSTMGSPTASVLLIAVLSPALSQTMRPASLDPAVPPPRFHA